jgi:hypothetical protein
MGIIGSHVDITSGWRGHQVNIEADEASRSGNWSDGDFATGMPDALMSRAILRAADNPPQESR